MIDVAAIKAEMARKSITQKELAKLLSISTSAMYMKMNSKLDFTVKELVLISKIFSLSIDELTNNFF